MATMGQLRKHGDVRRIALLVAGLQRKGHQRDVHARPQCRFRLAPYSALAGGIAELEAVYGVPIQANHRERTLRAGENAAAVPYHPRGQQHRIHRRIDSRRCLGQVLHGRDRPVKEPVVQGNDHGPIAARQSQTTNLASIHMCLTCCKPVLFFEESIERRTRNRIRRPLLRS